MKEGAYPPLTFHGVGGVGPLLKNIGWGVTPHPPLMIPYTGCVTVSSGPGSSAFADLKELTALMMGRDLAVVTGWGSEL